MERVCFGCMCLTNSETICEHCGFDGNRRNEPHQLQMGTVLMGKYVVGKVLGQGGFGITYLGWSKYYQRRVAIKEYFPNTVVDRNVSQNTSVQCKSLQLETFFRENRERFLREAQTLVKLKDVSQVVSIFDFFEVNNTAYIVMEYLQGEDLRARMRQKGVFQAEELMKLMKPVMETLTQVHEEGLVHRDISPDNIMLMADGSVKLMDFGAVRFVDHPGVDKELTKATQAIVKDGFAPVEQYSQTGSLGPWTDEYALCTTIYYCLTGKLPENAPTRIAEDKDLDWSSVPGLTEHQKKVLAKGTAVRVKDRYLSVRELMEDLYAEPAAPKHPRLDEIVVSKIETVIHKGIAVRDPETGVVQAPAADPARKKKLAIVAAVAAVVILLGIYIGNFTSAKNYAEEGQFARAEEKLIAPAITNIHDSGLVDYVEAGLLLEDGKYDQAKAIFNQLKGYMDADDLAKEADYRHAEEYFSAGKLEDAISLMGSLQKSSYKDSRKKWMEYRYAKGEKLLLVEQKYSDARDVFAELAADGYTAAADMEKEAVYRWGQDLISQGKYIEAYKKLATITGYSNVNSTISDLKETIYEKGQSYYRKGKYSDAKTYFEAISSYESSQKYLTLISCRTLMTGSFSSLYAEQVAEDLVEIFYFEDAAELLLSTQDVAEIFLRGKWRGDGKYFNMADDGYISYNLPWFNYGDYYRIEDSKVLLYPDGDYNNTKPLFRFEATTPDTIEAYCYKNSKSFTLTRQ